MLTTAISSSIKSSMFPENEKVATVVSLDKGKPEKNDISIFRPVSIIKLIFKVLWGNNKGSTCPKYRKLFQAHDIYL